MAGHGRGLYLSEDVEPLRNHSSISAGTVAEDVYQPTVSGTSNYMNFLHLVHTSLSDEENLSPVDTKPAGDNLYDNISPPSYETVASADTDIPVYQDPVDQARQIQEWTEELNKVEDEILTLRQVLTAKIRQSSELKRKLGITPLQEFKHDLQSGFQHIKESGTYQKTNEKIHQLNDKITQSSAYQKTSAAVKTASEKTSAAFTNIGASVSKKIGDIRNSQTFRSLEERVETTYASVKTSRSIENFKDKLAKVKGSKSENNFDESVQNEADSTSPLTEHTPPLNEKVPL